MNSNQVTLNELLPLIYQHIGAVVRSTTKEVVEQLLKNKSKSELNSDEDFLSAEQAADFLKIKLNTIYSKVEKGDLPHYRSGKRKLLFSKKELEEYISKRKGKSMDEISIEADNYINGNHGRKR